jgi:hypothetical protein
MTANFPHLEMIPIDSLVIHEWHDDQRTPPLISRIQESGVWRNPPLVTPLEDGSQRSMVLDGANRITALRQMDYQHAVVQVVNQDDPGLKLYTWNHVVWAWDPTELISAMRQIPGIKLAQGKERRPNISGDGGLSMVQLPRGDLFAVQTEAESLINRVAILNAIVDSYKDRAKLDRTNEWSVVRLHAVYPDLSGLVIFPHFEIKQVLRLAGEGSLLPAGITRFMVSPRVLHLNYPLNAMAAQESIVEKNEALQRYIHNRIAKKRVRYYAEATFLFDE